MVQSFDLTSEQITLSSDLAASTPIYIYCTRDGEAAFYSSNLVALLERAHQIEPLEICPDAVSFLLQSGVIPPPGTIYQRLYLLGIGGAGVLRSANGKVSVRFQYQFPFLNDRRPAAGTRSCSDNEYLELLAQATTSKLDASRPSFLFHSAGKDSNSIALALADAGLQDRITLITHKSEGPKDESGLSEKIAKKLGFRHEVLQEVDSLSKSAIDAVEAYFAKAPFPCVDGVSLAYPLYGIQAPELRGANIIDGMGNDVFIGHIPSADEFKKQKLSRFMQYLRPLGDRTASEGFLHAAAKYRVEHTGLNGFSLSDARRIYPESTDISGSWSRFDTGQDYLDLRAEVRGRVIDQEIFIRKVRNFTDAYGGNLVLPWGSDKVASFFSKLPEDLLFDRSALRNKLMLRELLKTRLGLDSDKLGKLGFSYNRASVVFNNWTWAHSVICSCGLWCTEAVSRLVQRLQLAAQGQGREAQVALGLIYRLLLISLWHSNSRFLDQRNG